MKREFLKGLGLEDSVIDKIMAENGADIEREKANGRSDYEKLESDYKALQTKFEELNKTHETLKNEHDTLNSRIEGERLDRHLEKLGVRNTKAIRGLLNLDKVKFENDKYTGLDDQITTLRKSDPYLFKDNNPTPPPAVGGNPGTGASSGDKNPFNFGFTGVRPNPNNPTNNK